MEGSGSALNELEARCEVVELVEVLLRSWSWLRWAAECLKIIRLVSMTSDWIFYLLWLFAIVDCEDVAIEIDQMRSVT